MKDPSTMQPLLHGSPPSADIPPNDAVRQSLEVRSARPGEELSDYQGGTNRRVQVTKRGWNRFDAAKKTVFLKWFAATCNAAEAARRAGVGYSTIFYHRARDARFAEAWDRALEQGYARLEAKLVEMQFEQAAGPAIEFDGAFEPPDAKLTDPEMALQLLKQHKAEVTRIRAERSAEEARSSRRRKKSRSYEHERLASDAEVRRALIKGLEAFGVRVTAEQEERVRRALSGE
jgi:hypothetical protein